jgi:hypothetical protein
MSTCATISLPTEYFSLPLSARYSDPWSRLHERILRGNADPNEWPDFTKIKITDQSPRTNIVADLFELCRL